MIAASTIFLNSSKLTSTSPSSSAKVSILATVLSSTFGFTFTMAALSSPASILPSPLVSMDPKTARSSSSVNWRRPGR